MTAPSKAAVLLLISLTTQAQRPLKGLTEPDDPANPQPAATAFHDPRYSLTFTIPAGWNFEQKDGVLSTFRSEVRTANPRLQLRGVATLNYNPYPPTTFAGATFYYSALPMSTAATCTAQTARPPLTPQPTSIFSGKPFHHGEEHHGTICTEARDDVYTAQQGTACLRFDLVINTFCHASSGALELSPTQREAIDTRMTGILETIRWK